MERGLADTEDKSTYWEQAEARLQELLQLDANFLDAQSKLQTARRWLALPDLYEKLLDALDSDAWKSAKSLFEQIRSVKPSYLKTQSLYERAWVEFVRAGLNRTVNEESGMEMILIPAGEFLMGSNAAENEKPIHPVYLDTFYISRYPVTNAEYKKFVDATKYKMPEHWQNGKIPNGKENHPVVNVSWNDAVAYCKWAGGDLPTEAQWEKAASWDFNQNRKRVYPCGDGCDANSCNTKESGIGDTTPVGKYSPHGDSAYSVGDMAGDVWEWCADLFDENFYSRSPRENPRNDPQGQYRVLRGGSFYNDSADARCALRYWFYPHVRVIYYGFRVAESVP